jgi:tRNA 5-methylaminomethyl-2-thiouridine biosynthesis bifunctional protein
MLCGRMPGDAADTASGTATHPPPAKHAIVVGAGLAGTLVAERLCARGWSVELFDRQAGPAMETSSNLSAVMLPMLSLDDNRASRLNRACYLHALRTVAQWRAEGLTIDGDFCGVLQLARDAAHRQKQQETLARCGFPESYVAYVDQATASRLAGVTTSDGGWWFSGGAWWNPASLCRAAVSRAGARLNTHYSTPIDSIAPCATGWSVRDAAGRSLAEAPQLILANAHDLLRFPQTGHLPLFRFRGQVSHLDTAALGPAAAPLRCVVCKEGYVSPPYQGQLCVGASFHRGGETPLRDEDQRANLERLESMLPGYLPTPADLPLRGKVGFRPVSPDKLPMLGEPYRPEATPQGRDLSAVERWPGLHVATGYGARGLVWSLLMAELLASQLNGDPLPLEADLAATVDPARFLLRRKEA